MTDLLDSPTEQTRRPGELTLIELLRWAWRQLTSMRTALLLLLLLALAAVPGSVIPQSGVDSLKTGQWQDRHPKLTPIYERLGLFSVYDSVWFAAIYLLLVVSLVGCIVPRCLVYWRAFRSPPPGAPRNLDRLPAHTSYRVPAAPAAVLADARHELRRRRYRVRTDEEQGWVAAERGLLRELGNLVFHLAVLVVLAGFAVGGLYGYQGGVVLVVGNGFANNLTQYDDFDPGTLFDPNQMEPFAFTVDDFDVEFLTSGPRKGMAQNFVARLSYQESPEADNKTYDLRVNHPLTIGNTDLFLIGHGYAPVITIRDGNGDIAYSGPTIFLPEDQSFRSFGVVKAPDARPAQIGLQGELYPSYVYVRATEPGEPDPGPMSYFGDARNPAISMLLYSGDLGLDSGRAQSVYALDTDSATLVTKPDGAPYRVDLMLGQSARLPDGMGTISFDGLVRWNRIQISQTPGKKVALAGVVAALLGLMLSLFIRPRRVWVRARTEGSGTLVEVAGLDRSEGGDLDGELAALAAALGGPPAEESDEESR